MAIESYIKRVERFRERGDTLGPRTIRLFQKLVMSFYREHGRHDFAWRTTSNPYRILVSEIMLQQTQTSRVAEKYPKFLKQFPTVRALARAQQAEVIRAWEGLGYYRRARNLHRAAIAIHNLHSGRVPRDLVRLRALPGIGSYTAAAVAAFAFGQAEPMLETNIRSVYLYCFFPGRAEVADSEVLALVAGTLLHENPREWFYALMDLGVVLKREQKGINRVSSHYKQQSRFKGSDREVAAKVLKTILKQSGSVSQDQLYNLGNEQVRDKIERAIERLVRESLIVRTRDGRVRAA
jgi:A/G-specific adenine glycosylase